MILRTLIGNAIKYADPDAPVRWVRVSFHPSANGAEWVASVADNGIGIPADQHHRVMRRFSRLEPERAERTGLGLVIASRNARRLGGRLTFESEPGIGSTFLFTLPATAVH